MFEALNKYLSIVRKIQEVVKFRRPHCLARSHAIPFILSFAQRIVTGKFRDACSEEDGFSLFEVVISAGLIVFTLMLSVSLMINVAGVRHKVEARKAAASALDDFINGLRAASSYDESVHASIIAGEFPSAFVLSSEVPGAAIRCKAQANAENIGEIDFSCKRDGGESVYRNFLSYASAPVPGAVLTPAPTDIIRMPVATTSSAP